MSLQNKNDFTKIPAEFARMIFIPVGGRGGLQIINGMVRMGTTMEATKKKV